MRLVVPASEAVKKFSERLSIDREPFGLCGAGHHEPVAKLRFRWWCGSGIFATILWRRVIRPVASNELVMVLSLKNSVVPSRDPDGL